jgi:FKBP-type peptidyl-prolyl cis-trans isomerase FkpA
MNRTLRPALGLLALVAALATSACSSLPTALDPRDVTFAPELGIDLDDMTRTATGLYYQDVEVGSPPAATSGRIVGVLYRGWLPDGTLFDESQNPANPLQFRLGVGMVIDGWDEGVEGMMVGGVRKLVVPPSLGYGSQPLGPIPGNSVLVFEIKLLSVN